MSQLSEDWWQFLRREELQVALRFFPNHKEARILEIGGMNGYQAYYMTEQGFPNITSVDVYPRFPQYFSVQKTTGSALLFDSGGFDVIYTSHVVAHIEELSESFREMHRVTDEDALFIHVVPTTAWSIVTNLFYYVLLVVRIPYLAYRALRSFLVRQPASQRKRNVREGGASPETRATKLKMLLLHPLGENPSFFHELYRFSRRGWTRLFERHGFRVVEAVHGPHLYSGYGFLRGRLIGLRTFAARLGFSGSRCFVLRKGQN